MNNLVKIIIIYSGKGGVGKTTTTANLAKTLAGQKKKVFVLDADVNTPSMNTIFKDKKPNQYLQVESLGYDTHRMIYIEQSMVRMYIRKCINKIQEFKPQYVLVDTPPSITDVHISLIKALKVSGLLMVTQPNELSVADVNRTHSFFDSKNVPTIGIIENMADLSKDVGKYNWPVLGRIPFEEGFDFNQVYLKNKLVYEKVVKQFKNLDKIILKNKTRSFFNEDITVENAKEKYGYRQFYGKKEMPKFINLATWEWIRDKLSDLSCTAGHMDEFLVHCTTDKIRRLLEAFKEDDQAYFMIVRAPNTEIPLFPGEIGQASLELSDTYYGVPKIKYNTGRGSVIIFPYECMPVDKKEIDLCLTEGGVMISDGRYIPNKEVLKQIEYAFGSRVGLLQGWEEGYAQLTI